VLKRKFDLAENEKLDGKKDKTLVCVGSWLLHELLSACNETTTPEVGNESNCKVFTEDRVLSAIWVTTDVN